MFSRGKKENILGSVIILVEEHIVTERCNSASFLDRVTSHGVPDSSLVPRTLRQQKVKIPTRTDDVNPAAVY